MHRSPCYEPRYFLQGLEYLFFSSTFYSVLDLLVSDSVTKLHTQEDTLEVVNEG
jgi:hypothetical protein